MMENVSTASTSLDVPSIGRAFKHISIGTEPPTLIALDASGANALCRYVAGACGPDDFWIRLSKAVADHRLPPVFQSFFSSSKRLRVDMETWTAALGEGERDRFYEFQRSHRRCSYLIDCLEPIFGQSAFALSGPIEGAVAVRELPRAKTATVALFSFFISALLLREPRRIKPSVRSSVASSIVTATSKIESFLFTVASGLSVALNAKDDPVLTEILQDEDLFRRSFDDDSGGKKFTLAELEAELRDP